MYITSITNPVIYPKKKLNQPSFQTSKAETYNNTQNNKLTRTCYPKQYYLHFGASPKKEIAKLIEVDLGEGKTENISTDALEQRKKAGTVREEKDPTTKKTKYFAQKRKLEETDPTDSSQASKKQSTSQTTEPPSSIYSDPTKPVAERMAQMDIYK